MKYKKFFSDAYLIKNKRYTDNRGFLEIFDSKESVKINNFKTIITKNNVIGTIRGLHFQKPSPQIKLIKVLKGEIFDVFVNINPKSKNFKKFKFCKLNEKNPSILFLSKDYAHGYQTLTKEVILLYYIKGELRPQNSKTIFFNDPNLNIPWPLKCSKISKKDLSGSLITEI